MLVSRQNLCSIAVSYSAKPLLRVWTAFALSSGRHSLLILASVGVGLGCQGGVARRRTSKKEVKLDVLMSREGKLVCATATSCKRPAGFRNEACSSMQTQSHRLWLTVGESGLAVPDKLM